MMKIPSLVEVPDSESDDGDVRPGWLKRQINRGLQSISRCAYLHPIHTIVVIALLASTAYIEPLKNSVSDTESKPQTVVGEVDVDTILKGSRSLRLGESTSWDWQAEGVWNTEIPESLTQHLALVTLTFQNLVPGCPQLEPAGVGSSVSTNLSAQLVPSTRNPFARVFHDFSYAYAVPFSELPRFLTVAQEIKSLTADDETGEPRKWVMSLTRGSASGDRWTLKSWVADKWDSFVDLIKHVETIDIVIMALGYLAMYLNFYSLFCSMRRLGSRFWLASAVLITGFFALSFGLLVTTLLNVPINFRALSEGLPFLVLTVGFEKPVMFTKAVLKASVDSSSPASRQSYPGQIPQSMPRSIQGSIAAAIKGHGSEIVQHYCIEIGLLAIGAASGVQRDLQQFCFLAAWILLFDCALLFTFYTSILCIKLEIMRLKHCVALRGTSGKNNLPFSTDEPASKPHWLSAVLDITNGHKANPSSVRKFKVFMVGGLLLINMVNLGSLSLRNFDKSALLSKFLMSPSIDPFKVAANGLDTLYISARSQQRETVVTVIPPIKFQLKNLYSPHATPEKMGRLGIDYPDEVLEVIGGRVLESLLKSVEDPIISKWVIAALTLSIVLNSYIFNAARWSINESETTHVASKEVDDAPKVSRDCDPGEQHVKQTSLESEALLEEKKRAMLTDEELITFSLQGKIPGHALEKTLEDGTLDAFTRAVRIRRAVVSRNPATAPLTSSLETSKLPFKDYNYNLVHGSCCENVIGYLPLPVGVAGPLKIDGKSYFIPMATTEGVLVAGLSRGSKAINAGGGAVTVLIGDGMARGPCVSFPTLARAAAAKIWVELEEGRSIMTKAFNSTSRFARLQHIRTAIAGTYLYIRFKSTTGDAMGMNMISKGCEKALHTMKTECGFDDMAIISLSANFCTDKKAAAMNWIDGRGKSVVAEAIIPGDVVKSVLKSNVDALVELNISKNLIGSAMAGSIGGFNAHASNIVTGIFLATGQDPAQNVESSNCITIMKNLNGDLQISVSMPSIEVGTVGGGTILEAQTAMLDMLGVRGPHPTNPGENARQLSRIVAASVLAGELNLCAALAAGQLVQAHMALNRSGTAAHSPLTSK